MKPNLVNKNIILKILNENIITKSPLKIEKNFLFFNFLIILLFILLILFLIYRYLEKKNNSIIYK
jgi:hypothetical protein